jgi:hypothetical protein
LSVLLRYTVSDCPFGIFKLFLYLLFVNFFIYVKYDVYFDLMQHIYTCTVSERYLIKSV